MNHSQKLIIISCFIDALAAAVWGIVFILIRKFTPYLVPTIIVVVLTIPYLIFTGIVIDKLLKKHFNDFHIQQEFDEEKKAQLIRELKRKFYKLYAFIAISALLLGLVYFLLSRL